MARKQPIELFMPPNMLKAKVGGGLGGPDMAAMKRAEDAMQGLESQFSDWIAEDVKALTAARARYAKTPGAEARNALLRAAHDIKGQATTFNFPLVARVAASLSRLLGELPAGRELPQGLADAHVQAVQVIHRENIQDTANPMAQMLCAELDAKVTQALGA
jgi:HPt (histidine-containing phosphotransfer) domain-containing protein